MRKSHNHRVDVTRLLAILGATYIHFVFAIYTRPDFLGGSSWWLANIINALSRSSVPLFIMLSGYLLLPKSESVKNTYQRLGRRIMIPLFVWFGIYVLWDFHWFGKAREMSEIATMIVSGSMYHMYFLVILGGLYALLPVFRLIRKSLTESDKYTFARYMLYLGMIFMLLQYMFMRKESMTNFFTMWIPYIGYFLLGAQLIKPVGKPRVWLGLYLGSLAATIALGYINVWALSREFTLFWRTSGVSYFEEYLSPFVVIMSISLFQLLMHGKFPSLKMFESKRAQAVLQSLAKTSFGVFLCHFIILGILDMRYGYAIEFQTNNLFKFLVVRSSLAIVGSFAMAYVLRYIPVVKKVVGE